jgi:hypothetical protein
MCVNRAPVTGISQAGQLRNSRPPSHHRPAEKMQPECQRAGAGTKFRSSVSSSISARILPGPHSPRLTVVLAIELKIIHVLENCAVIEAKGD